MLSNQASWIQFCITCILSLTTIVVLVITCRAANAQAKAANELTESTKKQIEANVASATAAREQVEVARLQITESLRPILTFRTPSLAGKGEIKNEGSGVALKIWWNYGRLDNPGSEEFEMGRAFIAPGGCLPLKYDKDKFDSKGLMIFYRSLSGIVSATAVTGSWATPEYDYVADIEELKHSPGWKSDLGRESYERRFVVTALPAL